MVAYFDEERVNRFLPERFKDRLRDTPFWEWRTRRAGHKRGPKLLVSHGSLVPGTEDVTFVVVCGGDFDQSVPNAGTMSRMGWCHGFEALGVPYLLLSIFELAAKLPDLRNPLCWISAHDYVYLDESNRLALSRCKHAVLVPVSFEGDIHYCQTNDFPRMSLSRRLVQKVLSTEPDFLFTISPESRFEYYEQWMRYGARLVSLPLACDTRLYPGCGEPFEKGSVDLAFVGGFWPYKARQFDIYLRPFSEHLDVFGYSSWPFGRYRGQIALDREGALYTAARVSPVINEPHVSIMGIDLNERVFKVLGSGGLAVTDATSAYRDWFLADELLVPDSPREYMEIARAVLEGAEDFESYRSRGKSAVLDRHTYEHRATRFLELMCLSLPVSSARRQLTEKQGWS